MKLVVRLVVPSTLISACLNATAAPIKKAQATIEAEIADLVKDQMAAGIQLGM